MLENNSVYSVAVVQSEIDIRNEEQMLDFFANAVSSMKYILEEVRYGKKIPIEELRDISLPLVRHVYESPFVPAQLAKVRKVDTYTYEHSINVGLLAAALGKWLKLPLSEIIDLSTAGFLHDIGKTQIPLQILNKPGKLTNEEMDLMKRHAEFGYSLVRNIPGISEQISLAALYHHERLNGSGYPHRLKGPEIPFFAKIVMVADVYDAITSDRVYRKNSSPFHAFDTIFSEQFGLLDPLISQTFLDNIIHSYLGTHVRLSNGDEGEVVFIAPDAPGRPTVRTAETFINLREENDVTIEAFIVV
jgi:HD-GYP domain-containing protein (c-di-GMP phosphodiesterase class II)